MTGLWILKKHDTTNGDITIRHKSLFAGPAGTQFWDPHTFDVDSLIEAGWCIDSAGAWYWNKKRKVL